MSELIDTHAHLTEERLAGDLSAVLDNARRAGVTKVIAVGITAASSAQSVELAATEPGVYATVGIHPNVVAEAEAGDWDTILGLVARPRVVGIGETGLDRYRDRTPFALQQESFVRHLELGRQRNLAVVIHCREAEAEVVAVLREQFDRHGPIRAVMHSFAGSWQTAQDCLAMGLYLSFAGMLTYPANKNLREVAAKVPADRVLVETDCPYLSPVPRRGQRNEPANVVHTAACLADVRQMDPTALAELTTKNAHALFKL